MLTAQQMTLHNFGGYFGFRLPKRTVFQKVAPLIDTQTHSCIMLITRLMKKQPSTFLMPLKVNGNTNLKKLPHRHFNSMSTVPYQLKK
jgi:hypothetical protein